MFHGKFKGSEMRHSRFVAIARPHPAEGIGRALQVAYRNGQDLPAEMCGYLERLRLVPL